MKGLSGSSKGLNMLQIKDDISWCQVDHSSTMQVFLLTMHKINYMHSNEIHKWVSESLKQF